jgi:hypothetical protein
MRQISSRLTFFYKFILPAIFAIGLINTLLTGNARNLDPTMPPYFVPVIGLVFLAWSLWLGWPVKKVSIFGDKLYVSNYRGEIAVPISEIVDVRGNILSDSQRITIYLRNETEFGSKIVFLATYRWSGRWSTHPIVEELLALANSQTEGGFLTPPTK